MMLGQSFLCNYNIIYLHYYEYVLTLIIYTQYTFLIYLYCLFKHEENENSLYFESYPYTIKKS